MAAATSAAVFLVSSGINVSLSAFIARVTVITVPSSATSRSVALSASGTTTLMLYFSPSRPGSSHVTVTTPVSPSPIWAEALVSSILTFCSSVTVSAFSAWPALSIAIKTGPRAGGTVTVSAFFFPSQVMVSRARVLWLNCVQLWGIVMPFHHHLGRFRCRLKRFRRYRSGLFRHFLYPVCVFRPGAHTSRHQ